MAEKTKIAWCHHTFNPWWGCAHVSGGCEHCYAESKALRWGFNIWGADAPRRFLGRATWEQPRKWNARAEQAGERRRVFCGSMCDVFEDREQLEIPRHHLFEIIADTPWLDWLLLTKRPENMTILTPRSWRDGWPQNVWALATVENQGVAAQRIGHLLKVPATIRGLSCEPLLGSLDVSDCTLPNGASCHPLRVEGGNYPLSGMVHRLNWIIVGSESGRYRRPCNLDWVRDLIAQARAAGVPVFVKQLEVNGRVEIDPRRWPEDLRIQEFPKSEGTLVP